MLTRLFILSLLLAPLGQALGQITKPTDAPNPLPPAESLKTVRCLVNDHRQFVSSIYRFDNHFKTHQIVGLIIHK